MDVAMPRLRLKRRMAACVRAMSAPALAVALATAAVPAGAAPIDDVRAAVGAPLDSAAPSAIAGAVREAIVALPPADLEQAIDLVGAVAAEVEEREAVAEIAGAAQGAIDTVAQENPDEVEGWWATIIKDSVLTVVEEKLAAAEQTPGAVPAQVAEAPAADGPSDAEPLSSEEDLPLVTVRELPAAGDAEPALVDRPPAPEPKPVARAEPEPAPEPAPEPVAEAAPEPDPPTERRITVRPVRQADRDPVQLAPPPRTLDQQLAERLADEDAPADPAPLAEEIATATRLLRSQGRPITTETLNQAMIELGGDCAPLDLEALRAAASYGRCRDELTQRLAGVSPAAGTLPGQTATAPPLDDRQAFRDMVRGYAGGGRRP